MQNNGDPILVPDKSGPVVTIDDDEMFRELLGIVYRRSSVPNEMVALPSSTDGLAYFDRVEAGAAPMPALALVDVNMPGMSGFELIESLRSREVFAQEPKILMLSCSSDGNDRAAAEVAGANGYVEKPIDLLQLTFEVDEPERPAQMT